MDLDGSISYSDYSGPSLEFAGDVSKLYVDDHYVYATSGDSVKIFAKPVSPFEVPIFLGSIEDTSVLVLSQSNDIFVEDRVAYVGSNEGVQILDVSDPSNIRSLGHYEVANGVLSMFYSDGLVYLGAYDNDGVGYLQILSVSNPKRIMSRSQSIDNSSLYLNRTRDIFVKDGVAYVTSDEGLQSLNVSNVRNSATVLSSNSACEFQSVVVGGSVYVSSSSSACNGISKFFAF